MALTKRSSNQIIVDLLSFGKELWVRKIFRDVRPCRGLKILKRHATVSPAIFGGGVFVTEACEAGLMQRSHYQDIPNSALHFYKGSSYGPALLTESDGC